MSQGSHSWVQTSIRLGLLSTDDKPAGMIAKIGPSVDMSDTVNVALSRCFTRFDDRAEKFAPQQIIDTFVAVGPLLDVLANRSSQIIYGRRGVGKTHALRYFEAQRDSRGDIAIYIDCSNLGSNNSVYNDTSLTFSERSTRLLIDMCICMHQAFLEAFTDPKRGWSLADVAPLLNDFTSAISEVTISGTVAKETNTKVASDKSSEVELGGKLSRDPEASFKVTRGTTLNLEGETKEKREGNERYHVNFNYLMSMTTKIAEFASPKRVWLLLDEWSTIGNDLQPYLADLVRRSFFSVANVSVKIAAIEQRSSFKKDLAWGGYLGIELGADAAVALNLDDYLVYDVNKERSVQVFRELIRNHIVSISKEDNVDLGQTVYNNWTGFAFTQEPIFVELVKASEGVPRDAMHILSTAAQRNFGSPITAPALRAAALQFFPD